MAIHLLICKSYLFAPPAPLYTQLKQARRVPAKLRPTLAARPQWLELGNQKPSQTVPAVQRSAQYSLQGNIVSITYGRTDLCAFSKVML